MIDAIFDKAERLRVRVEPVARVVAYALGVGIAGALCAVVPMIDGGTVVALLLPVAVVLPVRWCWRNQPPIGGNFAFWFAYGMLRGGRSRREPVQNNGGLRWW